MTVTRRFLIAGLGASAFTALPAWARQGAAQAAADTLDFDAFNAATDTPALRMGSRGAAVTRAKLLTPETRKPEALSAAKERDKK